MNTDVMDHGQGAQGDSSPGEKFSRQECIPFHCGSVPAVSLLSIRQSSYQLDHFASQEAHIAPPISARTENGKLRGFLRTRILLLQSRLASTGLSRTATRGGINFQIGCHARKEISQNKDTCRDTPPQHTAVFSWWATPHDI